MCIYSHKWLRVVFRLYSGATEKLVKTRGRQRWGWDQSSGLPASPAQTLLSAFCKAPLRGYDQGQGANPRLYCAKMVLFCSFPFFLSLSVVLREALIAAGSSALSPLMPGAMVEHPRWWLAMVSTTTALHCPETTTPLPPATLPGVSSPTGTKQGVEPISSFNRTC